MNTLALGLLIGALAGAVLAGDRTPVETCAYPDSRSAAAAWKPAPGSLPVELAAEKTPDGKGALRFPCDMAALTDRAYWDRAVSLDLSRYSRIVFWIRTEGDPAAIAHCTLYFNAGNGWYGQGFDVPDSTWQRVVLDRGGFRPEGAPDGWDKICGIRISFWKGLDRKAAVYMGGMEAETASVMVVRNSRAGWETGQWADRMTSLLKEAGVDAGTVDDSDVEQGVLQGKRLAVYAYSSQMSDAEAAALERFVAQGGRVIACYGLPPRLAQILGLADARYVRQERDGHFSVMRFTGKLPAGMPKEARQASWNVTAVRPAARNARTIAEWHDSAGKPTGIPAMILSDTGAFISHVVLTDDREAKLAMLRALLGHFDPSLWQEVAEAAVRNAGVGGSTWKTFDDALAGIRAAAARNGTSARVASHLTAAERAYRQARNLLQAKRYHEVLQPAGQARSALVDAFAAAQVPRPGEWRAFWCHSAFGVPGMTWDEAVALLKKQGFTAIVPNMLWGGYADYPSEVLPVSERCRREGDPLQACLDACRKHGLELHVWKVNWNLGSAPEEFVSRMRAEGRLQKSGSGEEERWLCPSHPANFQLERDSMLEVVRKYAVDGIHFDYIRYPDDTKCYCDGCRERFEKLIGKKAEKWPDDVVSGGSLYDAYQEFRRQNISRLVQAVAEEARRIRPDVKVSAAVFPNWPACRDIIGQDWAAWVQAGWLDFVCPMDYTASNREFRTRVQVQREAVAGRIPLYPGIGASAPGLDPVQVIEQALIAREEGVPGFIIFEYNAATAKDHLPRLGQGLTRPDSQR